MWMTLGFQTVHNRRKDRRVVFICQYLVLHHDSGNSIMAGKDGGPWRGTKVQIRNWSVYWLIGEGKWTKTRIIIDKWLQRVKLE